MSEETKVKGTEIPLPPDFPVEWENEGDSAMLWQWSDVHCPLPATPMSHSVGEASVFPGIQRVAQEMGSSSNDRRQLIVNGYSYDLVVREEVGGGQKDEQKEPGDRAIATIRKRWDNEFLPSLVRDLGYMAGVDLGSVPDEQLLEVLDEFLGLANEHWYIHFLVVSPMHSAADEMVKMYLEIMGEVPEDEPFRLLQGIDNMSLVVDRALQELAETARAEPESARAIESGRTAADILVNLRGTPEGRRFLEALDRFLDQHGYRPASFDSIYPSWKEDPSFVLLNVKSYLARPPRDLVTEQRILQVEARESLDRVLETIGDDREKRTEFMRVFEYARELWPLKEDHSYYIDQGSVAMVRMVVAEMGRRLAGNGVLNDPDDVHYLTLDQAREAIASGSAASLSRVTDALKAERERYLPVVPPQYIGTMPPGGLPDQDGRSATPPVGEDSSVLRGVPGSRGKYTGPARIVRGPDEFPRVQPGDVLVCTSTSPTWTPLFGSVGALVSDSGGALSHTAIVAREYGLPAAVGVARSTASISDGQIVTVDGDAGAVMLH